ncbi:MAG: S8 family peptidase [Saprospiraceae bacterium]|nr:S8 family peptidase [Saprospiraceae bacterium]
MKNLFLLCLLTVVFAFIHIPLHAQAFVEQAVNQTLEKDSKVSCVLVFQPLSLKDKIDSRLTKSEKGHLAFNLLSQHLKGITDHSIQLLQSSHIKYRVNILSSTINVYDCPADVLHQLQNLVHVRAILANYNFRGFKDEADATPPNSRVDYTWGLIMTETNLIQEMGYQGEGAVVGGNDTGFDWTHPAIMSKYRGYSSGVAYHNYNWHDAIHEVSPLSNQNEDNPCGIDIKVPCDDHSHGTHTMGTMVGSISDSITIGMAPKAKWIATRNMERGNGNLLSYLEALDWFLAPTDTNDLNPDPEKAPDVINNSWYCSEEEGCNIDNWNLMQISVANLKAGGVVVVASAGNSGPSCETIAFVPGMLEEAFVVGATNQVDTIAGFSSRGVVSADGSNRLKPDISAPGVGVYSSVLNHQYSYYSGTSMAGPHVAGLVALMVGANPGLRGQVDTIQEIIKRTAEPLTLNQDCSGLSGMDVPNPIYGYGRINALRAVQEALKYTSGNKSVTTRQLIDIFPNPARQEIIVPTKDLNSNIEIYDLQGKAVMNAPPQGEYTKIDVSRLHQGVYLIKIRGNSTMTYGKFLKVE